jgi:hypothetical protein
MVVILDGFLIDKEKKKQKTKNKQTQYVDCHTRKTPTKQQFQ